MEQVEDNQSFLFSGSTNLRLQSEIMGTMMMVINPLFTKGGLSRLPAHKK